MKRIAGILHFDNQPVNSAAIDRMLAVLKLQGDDEQSTWVDGPVGLGCTHRGRVGDRQKVPSAPLLIGSVNGPFVITFDGRVDNRRELLARLRPEWRTGGKQISDAEIVVAAYEKWGLECPKHLIGDFAFAIWDGKKHRLICVRDHLGVKPFYYYASDKSFLFAAAPEALLASGKVPLIIHEEHIADFLVDLLEGIDKTCSFYRNIFRLPPAHILIIGPEGMTLKRYWELTPTIKTELRTEQDCIESFRELFTEAVHCRLQNLSIPASMLSGGMDSSAIIGVGRKALAQEGKPLHVFGVISNADPINRETPHIFSVISQGSISPHLISETEISQWMNELVKAIEDEADPFDGLMNLNRAVYFSAGKQGVPAILDGIDGDILLAGSGHLVQLWRQGAYLTVIRETLKAGGLIGEYKIGRLLFCDSFLSAFLPFAPDWFRALRQPVRNKESLLSAVRNTLIAHDFAVRCHLGERFAQFYSHSPRPRSFTQIDFHKIALEHPFLTLGLERYERVAGSFGVEARHPYADIRLVEFCLGLPWQLKTHRGWRKMILRRGLESDLPSDVIWRKDVDSLMWEVSRLILKARADYFYQATMDERESLKPYVDLQKLAKFWAEYRQLGDETHAEQIWSGIALAFWLRRQRNLQASLK